ncbi:MAG: hypothetical protein JXQ90_11875 [Cyclobacteriaceae bacterium]
MRRLLTILSVIISCGAFGQHGLSFYHLRGATFQSTNYNPAFFPQGNFFLGLPAISGVNFYVNNRFSYNDAINNDEGSNILDVDNLVEGLGKINNLSTHLNLSLFHIGFRIPSTGAAIALFANERTALDVLYPKDLIEWAWLGNATKLGKKIQVNKVAVSLTHFREYGLALAYSIPKSPIKIGIRAKYLQGVVNASTPTWFNATIETDYQNYQLDLSWKNGMLRTAGVNNIMNGDVIPYVISNGNIGAGIDLGTDYRINKYYGISLAINDIGFIRWKEDVTTYQMDDVEFSYNGMNLKGARNYFDAIDTAIEQFKFPENSEAYTSMIPANVITSWTYTPIQGTDIIATANARIIQKQVLPTFGAGIRQYFGPNLILSASAVRVPQQFVNVGASFAATIAGIQLYAGVDKIIGYSVPNMKWAEGRVGINFIFGNRHKKSSKGPAGGYVDPDYSQFSSLKTESRGVVTNTFNGRKIKVKGQDGIYTIAKIEEPDAGGSATPKVVKNDRLPRMAGSATGTYHNKDKSSRSIGSATGSLQNDARPPSNTPSATGPMTGQPQQVKQSSSGLIPSEKRASNIQSATGQIVHERKASNNRSATGQIATQSKGRKAGGGSATGRIKHERKSIGNRSATGSIATQSKAKRRGGRSATGQVSHARGKSRGGGSATGSVTHQKGKRRGKSSKSSGFGGGKSFKLFFWKK